MVLPEAQYPDVYTDTFIFFLRSLCKIIWMNVHYFPNAPRTWPVAKGVYRGSGGVLSMMIGDLLPLSLYWSNWYKQYFEIISNFKQTATVELGWVVLRNLFRFNNISVISHFGNRRYPISRKNWRARPNFQTPIPFPHKARAVKLLHHRCFQLLLSESLKRY